jgi:pimeloyl-ACP methyl ester carboxylesterase
MSDRLRRSQGRPQVFWRAHGKGTPLVLINGYSASALAWPRAWTRSLERRYRVIALDNRGCGWSRFADTPFTIADLADDVHDVLDAAGAPPAIVMGLSMGGMIAQELALRHPARVAGLVLAATRPPLPSFTPPSLASSWQLMRPPARGEPLEHYFRALWSAAAARGFAEQHPDQIDELVAQMMERPTPRAMILHQLRAMSGWGHADRLRKLTIRTVVVHGEADRFSPPINGRTLARLIPGAQHVALEGVGHLLAHEAPSALECAIDGLIARGT